MLNTYDKDEILRLQAEQRDDDLRKYLTEMDWAENKGRLEGKQEGLIEGKKEVAKNLLSLGISIDDISKATGLSVEEIKKLK